MSLLAADLALNSMASRTVYLLADSLILENRNQMNPIMHFYLASFPLFSRWNNSSSYAMSLNLIKQLSSTVQILHHQHLSIVFSLLTITALNENSSQYFFLWHSHLKATGHRDYSTTLEWGRPRLRADSSDPRCMNSKVTKFLWDLSSFYFFLFF